MDNQVLNDQDTSCSICGNSTIKISRTQVFNSSKKFDWISDSTFNLSNLDRATVELRFCLSCFHSFLTPKFDTSRLYDQETGYIERKKQYEIYHPGKIYGKFNPNIGKGKTIFSGSSKELNRFKDYMNMFYQLSLRYHLTYDNFSILDWGGGDGYVSSIFANLIKSMLYQEVNTYIYDHSDWQANNKGIVSLDQIDKKVQLIIFSHILEHTHEPLKEIKQALDFADKNCLVLIEVPDERHNNLLALFGKKFGMHYHVTHFSRKSLSRLMNKSGIYGVKTKYNFNSSYRGQQMHSIIGIGIAGKDNEFNSSTIPFVYELLTSIFFTFRKSIEVVIRETKAYVKNFSKK
ncbi:methyltransferase domain-containing protein [Prochlorococcus sp. MIT 1341]|uniref:methyltransferase domain-containing protein n=1 Tax=Prochlorococcus sp. MIT 1341 TaxID=3096221 RepID=UPI002A7553E1|nr:methyltransferase domain-containing protein [Prochlorococcus sp. MIT 1341]